MGLMEDNRKTWAQLKRIAWIRVGALGDMVVGLASLAEMPRFFPGAKIVLVGPKLWIDVLAPEQFPYIESVAVIERRKTTAQIYKPKGSEWVAEGDLQPLSDILKTCDGAVNTQIDSYRYGFTSLRAGVKVRVGSAPASMAWLYTHASPFFGKDPLIHERDAALLLLEYATPGLQRFMRSTEQNRKNLSQWVSGSQLIAKWKDFGLPAAKVANVARARELTGRAPKSYVLVNPTASRREKTWPPDLMRECLLRARPRLKDLGLEAIVIGAPNETDWLKEVAGDEFRILQPKSLKDLQDILATSKALLTNGSSMQFMAGTTGTPVLTIFGRGQPIIWGPLGKYARIIRAKFENHDVGSTFAGFEEEVRAYRSISVDEVLTSFLQLAALQEEPKPVDSPETRLST